MGVKSKPVRLSEAALAGMSRAAQGDARKLAALSALAGRSGYPEQAYALAQESRTLAPEDADIASLTHASLTRGVPGWHFGIVRDEARNVAYDAALRRAVGPATRVLDIGSGTGLLAMMAARAGAGSVVTCERNPAVAAVAAEIVARNGYAGRVRVVGKSSDELDPAADMGGRAHVLVSEIVANDLLGEFALPVMEDAVARLIEQGGRVIPSAGQVRVALAEWQGLDRRRLGEVAGFDMSPFNRLDAVPRKLLVGDPELSLRSAPGDLFAFDFASGGPYRDERASLELVADGRANGVVQWIRLQLDAEGEYENRPAPGATSCWAALFHPFEPGREAESGETVRVEGAHHRTGVRIWARR